MGEVVKLDEIEVCASSDLDNNSTECPSKEESIGGPKFGDWASGVENGAGFLKDGKGLAEFFEILGKKASKIPDILDIIKAFDSNDTGYELTKTASKIWVSGRAAIWGSVRAIQLAMNSPFPKHPFFLGAAALLGGAAGAFGGSEAVDRLFDHLKSWGDSLGDRERSYSEYQKEFQKCLIDFDNKIKDYPIEPLPDDPFGREAFFEMMRTFDKNYVVPCYNKCKTSSLDISFPTAYETDGSIVFEIKLSTPLDDNLELHIKTMDGSAKAGEDYEEKIKDIITIPAGETSYKYSIKLGIDNKYEGEELFALFAQIKNDAIIKKYNLKPTTVSIATILDFPQEECPTTPKPNIKPISLNLPPTLLYPTTGGGSWGSGGSWSGGGGWGSGGYYPLAPSKPSLPNVPYIECYNEPYLNSMMIVKLPSLNSTRSFVALNYMSKDNSFNLSSPLLKDSLNSLNNKALNLNTTTSNSNKIYFDMNSDGFKERMIEWINEDEAVLVNDINNNGLIDNGTEILGNNYISNLTGSKSLDSYLLLKEFDTNKDGVIDIKDNSNLALWQDKNKNGITDKGELTYIGKDNSPIKSISINPLDTLLSAYDRNHDFKIDNKDIIYNYIYYKDNLDNSIDLYIYGDDSAKSFLDFNTTNHTILTNQGVKRVNEIHFYTDINSLPKPNTAIAATASSKIFGNDIDNIITGSSDDDVIYGYDGNDIINAGDGNDILIGGPGKDTLMGGNGNDIYKADRFDTIIDSDKKGFIYLDDKLLNSAMFIGKDKNINIYKDQNSYTYKHDTINNTLTIDDGLVIKDFKNGDLNINLHSQIGSDMVIVIDQTGSMGSAINSIKENAKFLINSLFNSDLGSKDSRVSVITYERTPNIIIPFTNNKKEALDAINKIGGTYGGTENINAALKAALNGSIGNFRDGVNKRIYLFGDESGDDNSLIKETINMANKQDVNIYTISINSSPFSSFKELSDNTQALSLATGDYNKVGKLLFEAMLDGSNENDVIEADENPNTINSKAGDDIIRSFDGDDIIRAGSGNDYIDAGKGNDTIYTGTGNDILFFKKGDGKDKIFYDSGNKILQFSSEITKNDISFYLDNKTFKLSYSHNDEIIIDINSLDANVKIELSDGNYLDTNAILNALKTMKEYSVKNSVVLNHDTIKTNNYLSSTIINLFKQGEVTKIKNSISTTINSKISVDLPTINPKNTLYADAVRPLTKSDFKELIISSGYTGINTNGITAKANANDGGLTFENRWYKSDTLDTIYESDNGEFKNSSGVVRDFIDAVNSDINLKNSVDNLGSNSDTISIDMDKILQDWVLGDSFLSNNSFLPPIVLDLNGNGTTSLSLDNTDAYFNYGEDYRRYKTAWIESGDAILGVDLNKDGIINGAFEVFGNKTRLKDGSFAKDGYEALKEFDSNKDGIINKSDDNFEKLVLWLDDGDAKGEAGELKTLSEVGINSISLTPKAHKTLENGNKISFESNFTKDDEASGVLRDVWFEVSSNQSIAISNLSNEDEKKISIVENFKGARLTNHQRANPLIIAQILDEYESIKYDMMSQILAKKLYGDNVNTCTLLYNALNIKLSRIITGNATPDETALSINLLASVLKKDFTYAIFKLNPNYLSNAKIKALLDKTGINFSINAKDLNSIKGMIGKNVFGNDEAQIFDFSDNKEGVNILSKGGNDILMGSNFHDKLNGGNGNDILLGNGGIDTLIGGGGNDLLIGSKDSTIYEYYLGDGDDIIYDDGGKDVLKLNFLKAADLSVGRVNDDMVISIVNPFDKNSPFGSITIKDGYKEGKIEEYFIEDKFYTLDEFLKAVPASNTYEFKKGNSFVEINDKGGIDKVIFGEGITPNDIITTKNGLNLEIAIKMDGRTYDELLDKLIINNFFTSLGESNGIGKIESFIFKSGIILNSDEILFDEINNDTFIIGDEKDNELIGTNNPNIINSKGGNDILKGLNGDDTYIYESGKDTIIDSGGNDKIVFGEGITRDNLQSKFIGNDLVIAIKESGVKFEDLKNSLTIKNQTLDNNKIEKIMYSDGSEFDIDTLKNREVIALKTISKTLQDIREINGVIKASDEDDDTLTFELIEESKFGIFVLNSNGSYTYKANDKFIGKDEAKVKISDGMGSEVVTTIKLNIVISAPKIDTTKFKFNEDSVLKNSIKVSNPSNSKLTYELVGDAKNSVVILNDDGNFMITPNLNYNGEDFITIKVTNEYGLSDIKTIALNILPINDAPSILNKDENNFILKDVRYQTGQIIASDVDKDKLSYRIVKHPSNGKLNLDSNTGKWSYELISKEPSSAIIEVSDLHGAKDTITLNFSSKISAPTIITDTFKFDEDTILSGNLSYVNNIGGDVKFELINNPKNSKITLDNSGKYTITPNLNFNGSDSIKVKVTNEFGLSFEKVINININPINDAPKFKESISNYELTNTDKVTANLQAYDIDSNNLTYKVVSNPTNGLITIDDSGEFTYIANKGHKGSDSAIVEVSDKELSTTKELKFNMKGYEYNGGNLEISSNDLIDTTLKLPNLNVEDIKFNRLNNDLILTQNSGDVTIKDYFTKGVKTIDTLIFKNNQTINIDNTKLVLSNKKSWQIKPSANLNNSGIIFSDLENSILNGSNKDDIIISTGDNSKIHAKDGNDTIILNGNKNEVYGSSKNDTLISNGKNNFLKGENKDDTYIIGKDANNTIIRDKEYVNLIDGGNDTLILNDIDKSSVEFKLGGSFNKDLIINYSNSNSKEIKTLTIQNQTNKYSAIENINLDGTMLGTETINKIIQDLNSYSNDNAINLNSPNDMKNNPDIMQLYTNGWN